VRWFERHRHRVAFGIALIAVILGWHYLPVLCGEDWPSVHAQAMAIAGSVILLAVVEVGFAWLLAMWETEQEQLIRARTQLPRAEVVRRS
jgi:hypothetical protein